MAFGTNFTGSSGYVPSFEATGLVIGYIRDPKTFSLNEYVGFREVKKDTGKYLQIRSEEGARIVNDADYDWPDGGDGYSVTNGIHNEETNFAAYSTFRRKYEFALGDKNVEQSDWDTYAAHAKTHAMKAQTHRTMRVLTVLTTAGNWGDNTDTATNLGGGLWTAATSALPYIKKSIDAAVDAITLATNGVIRKPEQLKLLLSRKACHDVAESQEMIDHLKQSPFALDMIKGQNEFSPLGLPKYLYGVNVIEEDAVKITSRVGDSSLDRAYAMDRTKAVLVARPDSLEGIGTSPTFNTCTVFWYKDEFTVETKDDRDNRRQLGRVVLDDVPVLTSPASGYLITAISS